MKLTCKKAYAQGDEVEIDDIDGLERYIDHETREARERGEAAGYERGFEDASWEETFRDHGLVRDLASALRRRNIAEAEFLLDKIVGADATCSWAVELGRYGTTQQVAA